MRKLGGVFAFMFLAAPGLVGAQEPFPDPPAPIMVNTPTGQVAITIPQASIPAQVYTGATQQPIVVPVPIELSVTPNVMQRAPVVVQTPAPIQLPAPAPAPVFPAQPPQPPANQSCVPIDGRAPLPFEPPMDGQQNEGPIRSTVLTPQGYAAQAAAFPPQPQQQFGYQPYPANPLLNVPAQAGYSAPYTLPAQGQPYFAPTPPPAPAGEPLAVPPPGIPYSLDAQGRPHYVQQPGTYQFPGPQQWPGYTPVQNQPQQLGYQAGQPYPAQAQVDPNWAYQQQLAQQQLQQQAQAQAQQQLALQQVPPALNPTINPNLTNPNTPVQLITPAQVQQALREGGRMLILDVRGELVRDVIGHLPNDIHVELQPSETFPARVRHAIPNASLPVVVYCNDGISSSQAEIGRAHV